MKLRKGNVFTSLCQEFCPRGGGCLADTPQPPIEVLTSMSTQLDENHKIITTFRDSWTWIIIYVNVKSSHWKTRMHSSRIPWADTPMPRGRCSGRLGVGGVYPGGCLSRGCLPSGESAQWVSTWRGCLPGRGCLLRGGCLPKGGCLPRAGVCPGGVCLEGSVGPDTPPVNRITDRCKNIAFQQLLLRTLINTTTLTFVWFYLWHSTAI